MSLLNISAKNALARKESLTKKEERVKKSWKTQEWTLYRKTYLQKMRSVEARKHSHQRIRDMYSKATFSTNWAIRSAMIKKKTSKRLLIHSQQPNVNDSAKKGQTHLYVAHRQTQLEPAAVKYSAQFICPNTAMPCTTHCAKSLELQWHAFQGKCKNFQHFLETSGVSVDNESKSFKKQFM